MECYAQEWTNCDSLWEPVHPPVLGGLCSAAYKKLVCPDASELLDVKARTQHRRILHSHRQVEKLREHCVRSRNREKERLDKRFLAVKAKIEDLEVRFAKDMAAIPIEIEEVRQSQHFLDKETWFVFGGKGKRRRNSPDSSVSFPALPSSRSRILLHGHHDDHCSG